MSPPARFHLNVVGPFYVVDGCCTLCGVPELEAPELFATTEAHCYVRRQPSTPGELAQMLSALTRAEFECIRDAGDDRAVSQRLVALGAAATCDSLPPGVAGLARDHAARSK